MPIQHSAPARQTRSHARAQAVLTLTPRASLYRTPAVPQLRAQLDRGLNMEGAAPSRKEGREPRRSISLSGVVGRFPGLSRVLVKRRRRILWKRKIWTIMQQMTQIIANLQEDSSSDLSRPPAFKTTSMKAPECFDGNKPFKVRSFIQSCQLIFHNDLENLSQDRKKVLHATSFLIGRAENWIEPYLSNLTNQDPN
ncbi:hypothetical protein O181_012451 [Austropuccinia psidii MF-1]|uniref:DUF4939 domain-containing protein n=1 Tax=Austropuccinia psidii MF-1 TaxID=1389203 RepID=A0A9Q3GMB7_9BASI|nr:hypothetical protein [Austropuccinia psidii MF-1]